MRRIVANFFISLDGVVESPDRWHFPYFDEQMGAAIGAGMASSDAMLMGGELQWACWRPGTDGRSPRKMNGVRKHVVRPPSRASLEQLVAGRGRRRLLRCEQRLKAGRGGHRHVGQWHPGQLAAAQRPARRAQPAGPPDRRELGPAPLRRGPPARAARAGERETFGSGVQHLRYRPLPAEAEEGVLFGG